MAQNRLGQRTQLDKALALKVRGQGARIGKALAPLIVLAVAIRLSVGDGLPRQLPGAALGWPWLFYLERAAAGLGVVAVVWLIGWRALHGHFPIKFGNVEYAAKDAADRSEKAVEAVERRLQLLEAIQGIADPPPED